MPRIHVRILLIICIAISALLLGCGNRPIPEQLYEDYQKAYDEIAKNTPVPGMSKYDYMVCDGGPHLVLPKSQVSHWKSGGMIPLSADYKRAMNITGKYGLISVGSGQALVLQDPPLSSWALSPSGDGLDFFVLDMMKDGNLDGLIDRAVKDTADDKFKNTGLTWTLDNKGVFLLVAGDKPGSTAYGEYFIPTKAGTYKILAAHYNPGTDESVYIYRLVSQVKDKTTAPSN